MEATIENTSTTLRAGTAAPASEEANEIRGMMPSFRVWHEAQHTLASERAVSPRARDDDRERGARRRWPLVLAGLAIVAGALFLERAGGGDPPPLTANW